MCYRRQSLLNHVLNTYNLWLRLRTRRLEKSNKEVYENKHTVLSNIHRNGRPVTK